MKAKITITMDNAAFHDVPSGSELARILRKLAGEIEDWSLGLDDGKTLLDINGNKVGEFKVTR